MDNEATKIEPVGDPADFEALCAKIVARIDALGQIDHEYVRGELRKLTAPLSNAVDPQELAKDLARIQAFKTRAVELVDEVTVLYMTQKRSVEILTKGWPRYSVAKSAESREGEALMKFSNFILALNEAETLYRYALGVMKNLESQQENVSRQISCAMVASNIGDRRYGRPDTMEGWDKFDEDDKDSPDGQVQTC